MWTLIFLICWIIYGLETWEQTINILFFIYIIIFISHKHCPYSLPMKGLSELTTSFLVDTSHTKKKIK